MILKEIRIFDWEKFKKEQKRIINHVRDNIGSDENLGQVEYDTVLNNFNRGIGHNLIWDFHDSNLVELEYDLANSLTKVKKINHFIDEHLLYPLPPKPLGSTEQNLTMAKEILTDRIKSLLGAVYERHDTIKYDIYKHWSILIQDILKKKMFQVFDLDKIKLIKYWPESSNIDFESNLDRFNNFTITTHITILLSQVNFDPQAKYWSIGANGVLFQFLKEKGIFKKGLKLKDIKKVLHDLTGSTSANLQKFVNKECLESLIKTNKEVGPAASRLSRFVQSELSKTLIDDSEKIDIKINEQFTAELFSFLISLKVWNKSDDYVLRRLNAITMHSFTIVDDISSIDLNTISNFFKKLKKLTSKVT